MPMKNKDALERERMEQATTLAAALRSGDEEICAKALAEYAEGVQQRVLQDAALYRDETDAVALASRGLRQLTADEKKFYQRAIEAMRNDPQQALRTENMRMPETVITEILDDVKTNHPLLEAIDFTPTSMMTTWIVNTQGPQAAVWGEVTAAIVTELYGEANTEQVTHQKLSAYFPVSNALLDLGPEWIDRYVREICTESIALGVENAIVSGTGVKCPIGMNRDIYGAFNATTGYPEKEAIIVTSFSPEEYGALTAQVAVDRLGRARNIDDLTLIINPLDYLTIVMPATIRETLDGGFIRDIFPIPTNIIKSAAVTRGRALLGLPSKYFLGIGNGTDGGKLEYSDHQNFLYDQRLYRMKLYGIGKPKDNNAFLVLDISQLQRNIPAVRTVLPDVAQVMQLLTITSDAGSSDGYTALTIAEPKLKETNTYKYKISAVGVSLPVVGTKLVSSGWTAWDGVAEIAAASDSNIVIAELDGTTVAAVGYAVVTAASGE